jgi:hypothetical protein
MDLFRWCLRSGRALAGLLLLATLFAGELADARHHLSEHGCATDTHESGRDDNCTCAGLHAAPLAGLAPVPLAAVAILCAAATPADPQRPARHGVADAAPRAPPRS